MIQANKKISDPNATDDIPPNYNILVKEISTGITNTLSEMITAHLDSTQEILFTWSNEADNNEDQTQYFELMNQIRALKTIIADDFIKNINASMHTPVEDEKNAEKDESEDELSLVEQDDMESIVLVKGIGERTAGKFQEQLSQLEKRLDHLAKQTENAFNTEAITPTTICQAYNDALTDDFDTTSIKILFALFDKDVAGSLDRIYDATNNSLIDAGILPKIQLTVSVNQSTTSAQPSTSTTPAAPSGGDEAEPMESVEQNGNTIKGFAMTAQPGNTASSYEQDLTTSTNNQIQSAHSGSYYDPRPSQGSAVYQHQTAGFPASEVGQALSKFYDTPFTPDTADCHAENSAIYPQSTAQHFGHQEILQALSNIQSLPQFDQPEDTRFDGDAVKQAIISSIAKTSGGAVTKGINQIADKTIDFIELIFDAIIEDTEISDTIKTLLLRLQIPVIKASMSDQEFFVYDDHPARELLDTIAEVGVGITDHTDETYTFLDKIVSDILNEYDLSTDTFKKALDELKAYVEEKEAVARAKEEEEQKQLLRKHARATILKSLRSATTGKILPESTHPLILKRWPTLMFNHYLANGKENDEWIKIVLTLRRIVDSVQPINSAEQLAKIQREKDALFELTEKYLNISSNSKKDVKNIIAVYKETIQEHLDDANFSSEEVDTAEKTLEQTKPEASDTLEQEEEQPRQAVPPNIMPGMWFQVYMGEDKPPRRCKLSVILIEDAKLMFVNHKGELIVEKSSDEFNDEIANGTTTVIMGHSAFENAFKSVINRIN